VGCLQLADPSGAVGMPQTEREAVLCHWLTSIPVYLLPAVICLPKANPALARGEDRRSEVPL
jgi:hypothetical protein